MQLQERTVKLLNDPILSSQDPDTKIRHLIRDEYMRRMVRYQRMNYELKNKYDMTFDEFLAQHMTKKLGYTWEVEKDAMDWETAIGGIETMQRQLDELRELNDA